MATIKNCTDISQSKRLKGILPIESADMGWYYSCNPQAARNQMWIGTKAENADIPCWSLAALLNHLREIDFFPSIEADEHGVTMSICYFNDEEGELLHPVHDITTEADSFVDACVEMILKFHEQKLL